MANEVIKHSDLIESNVWKPSIDETIVFIDTLKKVEEQIVKIAKVGKSDIMGIKAETIQGIQQFNIQTQKSNLLLSEHDKIKKKIGENEQKLDALMTQEAKDLAKLNIEIQKQNQLNKENARLSSDNVGAYDKLSTRLNILRKSYKDLAIVGKQNTAVAKAFKKEIDNLDKTLKDVDASVGQHQRNVGNYSDALSNAGGMVGNLTTQLKNFISNPIAAGIALVTGAVMGLKSAFEATERGMDIIGKQTSIISTNFDIMRINLGSKLADAFESVTDKSTTFGEKLSSFFSVENVSKFGRNIKNFLINPIYGLKTALDDTIKSLMPTGSQKLLGEMIFNAGEDLEDIQVKNATRLAKLERQFQENREQLASGNLQVAERKQLLTETLAIQDTIAKYRTEEARMELRILALQKQKYTNLKDVPHALLLQIAEAQAEIDRIAAEAAASKVKLTKQEATLEKEELKKLNDEKIRLAAEAEKARIQSEKDVHDEALRLMAEVQDEELRNNKELIESEKSVHDETLKLMAEVEQEQADADKKLAEVEKLKKDITDKSFGFLRNQIDKESELKLNAIEDELNAAQRREDSLRDIAAQGSQDRDQNLAFELRKQAELEAKRDKQIKKQMRQEQALAVLKALSSGNSQDITAIKTAMASLPSFYEGTEDTGTVNTPLDGNGGRLAVLHDRERVVDAENNKKLLKMGVGNDELPGLVEQGLLYKLNMTSFDKLPMGIHINDERQLNKLDEVKQELQSLHNELKNRPTSELRVNEIEQIATVIVRSHLKEQATSKRIGGLRG